MSGTNRTKVFISYSHNDIAWLERLQVHLKPLEREGIIERWDDTKLEVGEQWQEEMKTALETARVAVLLVSPDFFASDFIYKEELLPLLERAQDGGTTILPVIISPCRFTREEGLSRFQAVNDPKKPLVDMSQGEQEACWEMLVTRIDNLFQNTSISLPPRKMASSRIFREALEAAEYMQSECLFRDNRGELWSATKSDLLGEHQTHILYLGREAAWGELNTLAQAVRKQLKSKTYRVVVHNDRLSQQLERVRQEVGGDSVISLRSLLHGVIGKRIRPNVYAEDSTYDGSFFVEPYLTQSSTLDDTDPINAIQLFRQWIIGDSPNKKGIAVLISDGGVGKTTVLNHLFWTLKSVWNLKQVRNLGEKWMRLPLLINPQQWEDLYKSVDKLTLQDIYDQATQLHFGVNVEDKLFQSAIASGLMPLLFDGFDELCFMLGTQFNPIETLNSLFEIMDVYDSRIILTTRKGFWLNNIPESVRESIEEFYLLPFDSKQVNAYLEKQLPEEIEKRNNAKRMLEQIKGMVYPGGSPEIRNRITGIPLVLDLVVESVKRDVDGLVFEGGFDRNDPISTILQHFLQRETHKKTKLTEREQLKILIDLAINFGNRFTLEDLRLVGQVVSPFLEDDNQFRILCDHTLISQKLGQQYLTFRFDFLPDYLSARFVLEHFDQSNKHTEVLRILGGYAAGSSPMLEYLASWLRRQSTDSWIRDISLLWRNAVTNECRGAKSALFHLCLIVLEFAHKGASRSERSGIVLPIFEDLVSRNIRKIYIEGTVNNLDLKGVRFVDGQFSNVTFYNCEFDAESQFIRSEFIKDIIISQCKQFEQAGFVECAFDGATREAIQKAQRSYVRVPITQTQIEEVLLQALSRFTHTGGIRPMEEQYRFSGKIGRSPLCRQAWDTLERSGVIRRKSAPHSDQYEILKGSVPHVLKYVSEGIAYGAVRDSLRVLMGRYSVPE